MNNLTAVMICESLGSNAYSDTDKARAIHHILFGRVPKSVLSAELVFKIAKWLFNRVYIFDI